PLSLDRERIDWHARAQHARGAGAGATAPSPPATAQSPAGWEELRAFDAARRVRWLPGPRAPAVAGAIDERDRELLRWLAAARCALTSQVHRRLGAERSLTSTQRTLKRLADRGLVARFQLHRED